jgi:hypothetical protein
MLIKGMRSIRFQKLADIPVPGSYSPVADTVANDGSLLFLSIEQTGADAVQEMDTSGIGNFPRARMKDAKRFRLSSWRDGSPVQEIDLPALDLTFPTVDIFPDGKILVAGRRCAWRAHDDYDLNGAIFDPKTGKVSRILLGDGISEVGVDALGRIWVAYFDEGIFGNYGWGNPGPPPVGAAGLVCFSEAGEKLWEHPADAIDDCYALNVSGSEAAAFFFADFPICRISRDFKPARWKTEFAGCRAFAISNTEVLFSGQYDDPPDTGYLGRFESDGRMTTRQVRLLLPDGSGLPEGRVLGRGRHMYFFDARNVYRASLD